MLRSFIAALCLRANMKIRLYISIALIFLISGCSTASISSKPTSSNNSEIILVEMTGKDEFKRQPYSIWLGAIKPIDLFTYQELLFTDDSNGKFYLTPGSYRVTANCKREHINGERIKYNRITFIHGPSQVIFFNVEAGKSYTLDCTPDNNLKHDIFTLTDNQSGYVQVLRRRQIL